ncbi:MAG TPA: hypothetical protein VL171_10100 [Verrucomicrobiae bacterium]|nr:hypothetical protein [Verrucomicrobiae bacterium]
MSTRPEIEAAATALMANTVPHMIAPTCLLFELRGSTLLPLY